MSVSASIPKPPTSWPCDPPTLTSPRPLLPSPRRSEDREEGRGGGSYANGGCGERTHQTQKTVRRIKVTDEVFNVTWGNTRQTVITVCNIELEDAIFFVVWGNLLRQRFTVSSPAGEKPSAARLRSERTDPLAAWSPGTTEGMESWLDWGQGQYIAAMNTRHEPLEVIRRVTSGKLIADARRQGTLISNERNLHAWHLAHWPWVCHLQMKVNTRHKHSRASYNIHTTLPDGIRREWCIHHTFPATSQIQ